MFKFTPPDPDCHLVISLIKSVIRIAAGLAVCSGHLIPAGILFIVAETLGIAEELV
jgi:hypothetical protein